MLKLCMLQWQLKQGMTDVAQNTTEPHIYPK